MKKIIYVIAQGHTGSTLMDCILGTHPDVISSGELCYLNWQIERTLSKQASIENQDICTCRKNFSECEFWKSVVDNILNLTGKDIIAEATSFDRAFFDLFSYRQRDGHTISNHSKKLRKKIFNKLQKGENIHNITNIEPRIEAWVKNEYILYESMSKVGHKGVIVDSSKDLTKALLMQKFYPEKVFFVFIHRELRGLASSIKRRREKLGLKFLSIPYAVYSKNKFEKDTHLIKKNLDLNFIDIDYEEYVQRPQSFLLTLSDSLNLDKSKLNQTNEDFYIDPSQLHLVAGNPMRYKGKQQVKYDSRWRKDLSKIEKFALTASQKIINKNI